MPNEIDINTIIAEFSVQIVKELGTGLTQQFKNYLAKNSGSLERNLKRYALANALRLSRIRTLTSAEVVDIEEVYVPLRFGDEGGTNEQRLRNSVARGSPAMVVGTAGSGKSMFLRNHYLALLKEKQCIPVFFELRAYPATANNLFSVIYDHIHDAVPEIDVTFFRALIKSRKIEILLDGFDEVAYVRRNEVGKQILRFVEDFSCRIIVTTRPDDRILGWSEFNQYHISPMTQDDVIELIRKISFDEDVKSKFLQSLDNGLYTRHPDFLSIPLLTTIMLITFRQFAEIPDKVHIFYQLAFETLFRRHDAFKAGLFKREFHSPLAMDEFERVLGHLSATSYSREILSFGESALVASIRKSLDFNGLSADASDVLADLTESICMMMLDGLEYRYVHRSFQEYFTAHFICGLDADLAKHAIDTVIPRSPFDRVVNLCHQMNEPLFEAAWALPTASALLAELKAFADAPTVLHELYAGLYITAEGLSQVYGGERKSDLWLVLSDIYGLVVRPSDEEYGQFIVDLRRLSKVDDDLKGFIISKIGGKAFSDFERNQGHLHLRLSLENAPDSIINSHYIAAMAKNAIDALTLLTAELSARVKGRRVNAFEAFDLRPQ